LALLQYAAVVFIIFHLVVVIYEEPTLGSQFGESYRAHRGAVPRWASPSARRPSDVELA